MSGSDHGRLAREGGVRASRASKGGLEGGLF